MSLDFLILALYTETTYITVQLRPDIISGDELL